MFSVEGKVALVTGALGGIGIECVKTLLNNKIKAIALLDIQESPQNIKELKQIYNSNNIIFIKTDVSKKDEVEAAFKTTIATFKQLDIVLNNAGIACEENFEKCLGVNFNGPLFGTVLALDYIAKYKSGQEGVVLNTASTAEILPLQIMPFYSISKQGVVAIGRTLGSKINYDKTGVKILTVCPGFTDTPMTTPQLLEYVEKNNIELYRKQTPEFVSKEMLKIIKEGDTGSVWLVNDCQPALKLEINTFAKNCEIALTKK